MSARNGFTEMSSELVKNGADVSARTSDGLMPIDLAISEGHDEVLALLRELGGKSAL